jgi:hypothetical protein
VSLQSWIYRGVIDDPSEEFMVCEQRAVTARDVASPGFSDHYWNDRYSLATDLTPTFLHDVRFWVHKSLRAPVGLCCVTCQRVWDVC